MCCETQGRWIRCHTVEQLPATVDMAVGLRISSSHVSRNIGSRGKRTVQPRARPRELATVSDRPCGHLPSRHRVHVVSPQGQVDADVVAAEAGRARQVEASGVGALECTHVQFDHKLWQPKHHVVKHLGHMLRKHGMLQPYFVQHLFRLQRAVFKTGISAPRREASTTMRAVIEELRGYALPATSRVVTSACALVRHRAVSVGDIAWLSEGRSAEVRFHVEVDGIEFPRVSEWHVLHKGQFAVRCQILDDPTVLPRVPLVENVLNSRSDREALVLLPLPITYHTSSH